jgi:hypothetical protein
MKHSFYKEEKFVNKELTEIEEMLIAKVFKAMSVYHLRGEQKVDTGEMVLTFHEIYSMRLKIMNFIMKF